MDGLRVEVKDSGRGIPKAKQLTLPSSGGVGLRGMQERIRQLGGTLEIDSSKNGTVAENLHGNWNIERGHVTPERIKGKAVEG